MSTAKTLDRWAELQAVANALDVRDDQDSTVDEMRVWIEAQETADAYLAALRADAESGLADT